MSISIREITKQDTLFLKGLAICGMLIVACVLLSEPTRNSV